MRRHPTWATLLVLTLAGGLAPAARSWALDGSVPAVRGDVSRLLLGDGTGVVLGMVDSGIDGAHPTFDGLDSLGNPRLVAQQNFVLTEPENLGDDVFGHGTQVASAALGSDSRYRGLASDARYVNARVLDQQNNFATDAWVKNGIGFAIEQGADVLNLSLNFFSPSSGGNNQLDLMLDWAADEHGIHSAVCAGNISQGSGSAVRSPGSAFNALSVGRTDANFDQVHSDSATSFTADGRMKPDIVAPGTSLTLANDDWEGPASDYDLFVNGCSFATPHVAGMIAQQIEAGRSRGLSTSPLVVKATMLNSADHGVLGQSGMPWTPTDLQLLDDVATSLRPLDESSGAGQLDGLALSKQYLAGEQGPGTVLGFGWDENEISEGQVLQYHLDTPLEVGSTLTTTLTWLRHVTRVDDGDGIIDDGDTFFQRDTPDDLQLAILRDGVKVAESISAQDNLQHLHLTIDQLASYSIEVFGANLEGLASTEAFALAWSASSADPFLTGDFNLDGLVDEGDLSIWQANVGSGGSLAHGDANGDGRVDGADFLLWQANFASSGGAAEGGASATVPEPLSMLTALVALGAACLFAHRS